MKKFKIARVCLAWIFDMILLFWTQFSLLQVTYFGSESNHDVYSIFKFSQNSKDDKY